MKRARWFICIGCQGYAATFSDEPPQCRNPRCKDFGLDMEFVRPTVRMPWWREN